MYHRKDKLGEGIAPNEVVPLLNFIISILVVVGITGYAFLSSGGASYIKEKAIKLYQKLRMNDAATKLQNADDKTVEQAINMIKQGQDQNKIKQGQK